MVRRKRRNRERRTKDEIRSIEERAQHAMVRDPLAHVAGECRLYLLPPDVSERLEYSHPLRDWWHTAIREHGYYSCYAILLVLPSDKEAIRYAVDFGRELDLISRGDCLVLVLTDTQVRRSGFDEDLWQVAVLEQAYKGHSQTVADLFGIGFDEFPCLVVFRDIRSPEHILVKLKGMTAEEIADQMRTLFTVVHKAVSSEEDPLEAIERYQKQERVRGRTQAVISQLRSLPGKTLEIAMEAWVNALITTSLAAQP
jgi:hypothetical protein